MAWKMPVQTCLLSTADVPDPKTFFEFVDSLFAWYDQSGHPNTRSDDREHALQACYRTVSGMTVGVELHTNPVDPDVMKGTLSSHFTKTQTAPHADSLIAQHKFSILIDIGDGDFLDGISGIADKVLAKFKNPDASQPDPELDPAQDLAKFRARLDFLADVTSKFASSSTVLVHWTPSNMLIQQDCFEDFLGPDQATRRNYHPYFVAAPVPASAPVPFRAVQWQSLELLGANTLIGERIVVEAAPVSMNKMHQSAVRFAEAFLEGARVAHGGTVEDPSNGMILRLMYPGHRHPSELLDTDVQCIRLRFVHEPECGYVADETPHSDEDVMDPRRKVAAPELFDGGDTSGQTIMKEAGKAGFARRLREWRAR